MTNWQTLMRRYGRSKCVVTCATGKLKRMRLCAVKRARLLCTENKATRITRIRIHEVRVHDVRGECAEKALLEKLASTRYGGQDILKTADFKLLERLWGRTTSLRTAQQRASAQHRLSAQAMRGWGVSLRAKPILRV